MAYNKAIEMGLEDKAETLKHLMEEEEYDSEAGKTRLNLVRERPMRKTRSARYQVMA